MSTKLENLHRAPWKHMVSIDSTNAYILRQNCRDLPEGFTCSAQTQTHGQGRQDRIWHSPQGGLYLSILLKPTTSTQYWSLFPFIAALAAAEAIEMAAPDLTISLKWPNDLLLDMKKTGGILIQSAMGAAPYLVCGVGINIDCPSDKFPPRMLFPATSLGAFTPKTPAVESLARKLRNHLFNHYIYWENSPDYFLDDWESRSVITDRLITIKQSEGVLQGICRGIRKDGFLLIETSQGNKAICTGDIIEIGEIIHGSSD